MFGFCIENVGFCTKYVRVCIDNVSFCRQPNANDFHYRHIVYQTTQSTTADLFDLLTLPSLRDQTVLTILREPLERMISEYAFAYAKIQRTQYEDIMMFS